MWSNSAIYYVADHSTPGGAESGGARLGDQSHVRHIVGCLAIIPGGRAGFTKLTTCSSISGFGLGRKRDCERKELVSFLFFNSCLDWLGELFASWILV